MGRMKDYLLIKQEKEHKEQLKKEKEIPKKSERRHLKWVLGYVRTNYYQ